MSAKPKIIDASVAIKWFIPNEPGRDAALHVLDEIRSQPETFVVPELFFNEMLAVLCKLTEDSRLIIEYLTSLEELGFHRLGNGRELLKTAVQISKQHKISGYDALYAASARLIGGIWLTADAKAHTKLETAKLSQLLSER